MKIKIMDPAYSARDGWHNLYGSEADALNGNISRIFLTGIPMSVQTSSCRQPDDWSCGPHAMAEALGQSNGEEVRAWLLQNGLITSAYGTDYSGIGGYLAYKGYSCTYDGHAYDGQMTGFTALENHLKKGYKVILCMHHSRTNYWTNGGHYICAYACDETTPTTGDTYTMTLNQIKIGNTGVDVLLLEEILKARNIYAGALDRSFGPQLDAALRKYQTSRGLTVDGICGPTTWKDLIGK